MDKCMYVWMNGWNEWEMIESEWIDRLIDCNGWINMDGWYGWYRWMIWMISMIWMDGGELEWERIWRGSWNKQRWGRGCGVYTKYIPNTYQVCTKYIPSMYQVYIKYTNSRLESIWIWVWVWVWVWEYNSSESSRVGLISIQFDSIRLIDWMINTRIWASEGMNEWVVDWLILIIVCVCVWVLCCYRQRYRYRYCDLYVDRCRYRYRYRYLSRWLY